MNKKSLVPIIIFISIALGFFLGRFVYKSKNIFYSQNKEFKQLSVLIDLAEKNYADKINVFDVLKKDLMVKLSAIDPYLSFYSEKEYVNYKNKITGEFNGIGIKYYAINDTIRILDVFKNSPAEKAGLKKLDAILKINNQNLIALSTDSLSKIIKRNDKSFNLTVLDYYSNTKKTIKLEKKIIQINPVIYYYLDSNTAYIKIISFQKNTFDFFQKAEKDLLKKHKISKVILDLRNNGGGILQSSVDIVNEFFSKGDTITTTQTNTNIKKTYISTNKGNFKNVDLIVLVNYSTASAAELVAMALQDNDRALIIGTKTYGKGVFQQDLPVLDKNIAHITTGKYFGPSGRNINEIKNSDSSKIFKTKMGRIVFSGNAITPDVICDSIDFEKITEDFDILFISMIDANKKQILSCSNPEELFLKMKNIIPLNDNSYLNYLSTNTQYFEKIKYFSVAKFILQDSAYYRLILDSDYCLQNSLRILNEGEINEKILKIDTLKIINSDFIE